MSEASDYYAAGGPIWLRRNFHGSQATATRTNAYLSNWHFCFPQAYPVSQLRFYGWGQMGDFSHPTSQGSWRPRTEEFFHGAAARNVIPFRHLSCDSLYDGSGSLETETCVLGCDVEGGLWCFGAAVPTVRTLSSNYSEVLAPGNANAFGIGPYNEIDLLGFRGTQASRSRRNVATRILGDGGDIESVKFVKTQIISRKFEAFSTVTEGTLWKGSAGICASALSSDGDIWIAGKAAPWAPASAFPSDTDAQLPYFRRLPITSFVDGNCETVTQDEPLVIKDYWHRETLLALTEDDRLFMTGENCVLKTTTWHELAGFVDTVTITNEGAGYTTTPVAAVSAPPSADGVTAVVSLTIAGGKVTGARILNPGRGYGNTPPTITVTGGGGANATISCTVHSGKWVYAAASYGGNHCAAIDEAGRLFTWGVLAINNTSTAPTAWKGLEAGINGWPFPVLAYNATGKAFNRVYISSAFSWRFNNSLTGVALTSDGEACYWGFRVTPTDSAPFHPRLISDVSSIGNKTFVDASVGLSHIVLLDSDGVAYTAAGSQALSGRSTNLDRLDAVDQGGARWTRVFAGAGSTLAIRDEEVDHRGNRINPLAYSGPGI